MSISCARLCSWIFSALIGVRDLLVVDTEDALLICHRERAQDVRLVVQHLETTSRGELC